MKFSTTLQLLSATVLATAATVKYDAGYDDGSRSLSVVACSDGQNGLMTRFGWQTQGDIPKFPYIGASDSIASWNSPNCGQCLSVTYGGNTIHVLAIDHAASGVVISTDAMNALTSGQAVQVGTVDATVQPVDVSNCGLKSSKRQVMFSA